MAPWKRSANRFHLNGNITDWKVRVKSSVVLWWKGWYNWYTFTLKLVFMRRSELLFQNPCSLSLPTFSWKNTTKYYIWSSQLYLRTLKVPYKLVADSCLPITPLPSELASFSTLFWIPKLCVWERMVAVVILKGGKRLSARVDCALLNAKVKVKREGILLNLS